MSVVHESWLLYPSWRSYSGIYRASYWYAVGVLLFFWFSWSLSVCKVPHIQAHIVPHTIQSTTLERWVFEALFQPESISSTDVKALFLISLSSGFRVALRVSLLILNTSRQSSALPPFSALLVSSSCYMCFWIFGFLHVHFCHGLEFKKKALIKLFSPCQE